MRAANAANDVRRTILFMIGVQDEQNVESAFKRGIRPVARFRGAEKHIQEIPWIAQLVIRIDERHSQGVTISERGNRRHFAD